MRQKGWREALSDPCLIPVRECILQSKQHPHRPVVRSQSSEDRGLRLEHPGETWLDPTNDTSTSI